MPMVIPIVAVFASGAVGAVIAGTATFAAYASVAGAMLSTAGALSGNKDLSRIGAIVSIGGGIANVAGIGSSAGSGAAANAAASAADVEANLAIDAASASSAAEPAAAAATGAATETAANTVGGLPDLSQSGSDMGWYNAAQQTPVAGNMAGTTPDPTSLIDGATNPLAPQPVATSPVSPVAPVTPAASTPAADRLAELGKGMTWGDIQSYFGKAQQGLGQVGTWMKDNPALVKVGGEMLSSMYGPNAERMSMEKSLMERARANLNNPIKMSFNKTGG